MLIAAYNKNSRSANKPEYTEVEFADIFIEQHGEDVRYVADQKQWLNWNVSIWERSLGEVSQRAIDTARSLWAKSDRLMDAETRRLAIRQVRRFLSHYGITGMLAVAKHSKKIAIQSADLDRNPNLLGVRNGVVDLVTGKLCPARRQDLVTRRANVTHDHTADCPEFRRYLAGILPESVVRFLQTVVGYALTGHVFEKVIVFLVGAGNNGKTTLMEVIRFVLGEYSEQLLVDSLLASPGESSAAARSDFADLQGKRFVSVSEPDESHQISAGRVKYLSGMGEIKSKHMRQDHSRFSPTHTLFMDVNSRPRLPGSDLALWSRVIEIPFRETIPKDKQDKHLLAKLKAEAPGILNWMIDGCVRWQSEGLVYPEEVRRAIEEYQSAMDPVGLFLGRCTMGEELFESKDRLYRKFVSQSEDDDWHLTKNQFGRELTKRGIKSGRVGAERRWVGLRGPRCPVSLVDFED